MRKLMVAFVATLVPLCAQAKPADLVEGCSTGAVDPKLKQALVVAAGSSTPYFQVLLKGISAGAREANSWVSQSPYHGTDDEKRCAMAVYLYGPEGTIMKNLIIPLK
jgi:hypothetical protein